MNSQESGVCFVGGAYLCHTPVTLIQSITPPLAMKLSSIVVLWDHVGIRQGFAFLILGVWEKTKNSPPRLLARGPVPMGFLKRVEADRGVAHRELCPSSSPNVFFGTPIWYLKNIQGFPSLAVLQSTNQQNPLNTMLLNFLLFCDSTASVVNPLHNFTELNDSNRPRDQIKSWTAVSGNSPLFVFRIRSLLFIGHWDLSACGKSGARF